MKVLVCGGRDFYDVECVYRNLDILHDLYGFTVLIHGAAPGADRVAVGWALAARIPPMGFSADWRTQGKAAGPLRNQRMLDVAKPELVVAFPGGRGTADMTRRAEAAGVKVIRVAGSTPE